MRRRRRTSLIALKECNEINMTSLMDVIVLLLFAFIITMPVIEQSLAVDLPKGKADNLDLSKKHHTIEITLKKGLTLDGEAISIERLDDKMRAIGGADPKIPIYLKADEKLDYGKVVEVIQILKSAKIENMGLVTQAD